jgi:diguanylate cyclase (GGDEF)-like protein/putative nucleotidyltransferase with HDIG domain
MRMHDLSLTARTYIVVVFLAGAAVTLWGLSTVEVEMGWLWLLLGGQAIVTFIFKGKDSVFPYQRSVSLLLILAGVGLVGWQLPHPPGNNLWLWLGLSAIAAATHILKQEGPTARSSYQISFVVYGFAFVLLGVPGTLFVIVVAHLLEYTWGEHYPWYILGFNIATFTVSMAAAALLYGLVNPTLNMELLSGTAGVVIALAVFTLINHALIGLVLTVARGQSLSQSGVFGFLTLMIDFSLLCMGAGAAVLWEFSPNAAILGVIPLYLIYSTLRLPALKRQAELDEKTGAFNAGYFTKSLESELDRAHRFDRPLTVVMADLDLLRNINNSYGHLAGDVVLEGVARALQEQARSYDVVARFGGEEFAVLLPETTPEEAYLLVEGVRKAIESTDFRVTTSLEPIRATMSFGIAGRQDRGQSTDGLIHCADMALYRAKANGRNQVVIYSRERMPEPAPDVSLPADRDGAVAHQPEERSLKAGEDARSEHPVAATQDQPETPVAAATQSFDRTPALWQVNVYIAGVVILASILVALVLPVRLERHDWVGLIAIVLAAVLAEVLSVELYLRETVVSTSAAPMIAGSLLFGPVGALLLGIAVAIATFIKNRSTANRLFFNAANFIIGNMICVGIVGLVGGPFSSESLLLQFTLSLASAVAIYVSTTALVAGVVSVNTGQLFNRIWSERFRWLAVYYLALGVVAFALISSYYAAGLLGIIVILAPLFMLRFSQMQYIDHTRGLVGQLRQSNVALTSQAEEITLLNEELLLTLAAAVDLRDPDVLEHSKHVTRYATLIAEELGLSSSRIELIRKAGLLHDIGKLGIPESILFKPASLTRNEYELVKRHVNVGADLIHGCHSLRVLIPFVLHHHEHIDGSGYPHGLKGEEIPLEARIIGLADAVEAMASDRPYKQGMDARAILEEISRCSDSQFDPVVARAFEQLIRRRGEGVIVNSARNPGAGGREQEKVTVATAMAVPGDNSPGGSGSGR